jgi:N-acetylglucosamine-6-phosphate deacetylase
VVTVRDGRIAAVGRAEGASAPRILCPGFVDIQVNGIDDVDVSDAEGTDWERLDALVVAQGVTTWCPTLTTAPLATMRAAVARIAVAAARPGTHSAIAGAHLEGPWLGGAHGAHPSDHVVAPTSADVAMLPEGVALVTLGPEVDGASDAVRGLVSRKIAVSLGHSRASYEIARRSVDEGATLVTHLGNAMGPLLAREPGLLGLGLADDRVAVSVIADLVHVHPAVLRVIARAKAPHRLVLVTDAVATRGSRLASRRVQVVEGAPRLPDGTIAGSVLTMDAAVRNMVSSGATDLASALRAASAVPADLLGLDDRGTITVGARADLVALKPDLTVEQVWIGGVAV